VLPAEIAQAVKRIQFVTGRHVADVMAGAYLSVFKGRGMEFDEVRPYVPGDDVRAIDWNVTARTGEPHIKRFVEERELTVMLLVDVSASQEFGSGRRSKLEAAVELSALLAMSAVENGDKVGLLLFPAPTSTSRRARAASTRCASCARCSRAVKRAGATASRRPTRHVVVCAIYPARCAGGLQSCSRKRAPNRAARRASPRRSSSVARCCRAARCCS
jgi:uncharacterized protein (DUF58 family)